MGEARNNYFDQAEDILNILDAENIFSNVNEDHAGDIAAMRELVAAKVKAEGMSPPGMTQLRLQ